MNAADKRSGEPRADVVRRLYQTVLFDLDGTLVDSHAGIARSLNHALRQCGYACVDTDRVKPLLGPPLEQIFTRLLGTATPADLRRLVTRYREHYAAVGLTETTVYPGVSGALADLQDSGFVIGVCTSKRRDFAEAILDLVGLRNTCSSRMAATSEWKLTSR